MSVDVVYVAAASRDARLTRICIASIRTYYPLIPIRLLSGGPISPVLLRELEQYWDVTLAALPEGEYGWGFVKLEPLFDSRPHRFLVLDSDTVLTGTVLDNWPPMAASAFLVDREEQSEAETRRLYYDWQKLAAIDRTTRKPDFVFNSGQWFGKSGVLSRADFDPWLEWTMPRKLRHPDCFMPGDQGVLNYVLNHKAAAGLQVAREPFMLWPGHGMRNVSARSIDAKTCPSVVVHWAGMKRTSFRKMVGGDVLGYFEQRYYARLPAGRLRRQLGRVRHVSSEAKTAIAVRCTLAYRKWIRPEERMCL